MTIWEEIIQGFGQNYPYIVSKTITHKKWPNFCGISKYIDYNST